LLGFVLADGRSRLLKQSGLELLAREAHAGLVTALGSPLVAKLQTLLAEVATLTSTRQAAELAETILELLKQEQARQEQQSPAPGSQEEDGHRDESPSSKADEKKQPGGPSDGSDPSAVPSAPGDPGPAPASSGGKQKSGTGGSGAGSHQKRSQTLEQLLNGDPGDFGDLGRKCAEQLQMSARTTPWDQKAAGIYPGEEKPEARHLGTPPDLHQVRAKTAKFRARIAGMVQASRIKRTCAGRAGRWMDHRVLHRLSIADPRVFRRKEQKVAVNTAIVILLDRSGSMCTDGKIILAREAVMALTDVLGVIPGVNVAAAAFPGTNHEVVPLTSFGQSAARTKANYGILDDGGTPLGHALAWARARLAVRREPRKIVFVATDGVPDQPELVQVMTRKMEAEGTELMGLGILDGGKTRCYFKTYRTIDRLEDLPEAVFGMLQTALTA
jgi:Mg-chelatase subunit ChlD